MSVIFFLEEVIMRTPIYAWVILVLLIKRGLNASRDNVLSFPRMLIFPAIFILWGLDEVVKSFAFPGVSILSYVVLGAGGTPVGYVLYSRFRSFYQKDGLIYRTGTYLPMVVMMLNFLIKYAFNIAMSIAPAVYESLGFNLCYSMVCGFLVGLSIGGILQAYRAMECRG